MLFLTLSFDFLLDIFSLLVLPGVVVMTSKSPISRLKSDFSVNYWLKIKKNVGFGTCK